MLRLVSDTVIKCSLCAGVTRQKRHDPPEQVVMEKKRGIDAPHEGGPLVGGPVQPVRN